MPNDLEVGLLYSSTGVSMEVKVVNTSINLLGDYNNDGSVDAADYSVWRNNLGVRANSLPNDDTPGVGQDDYTRWKAHFGETLLLGAGSARLMRRPLPAFHGTANDRGVRCSRTDSASLVPRQASPRTGS